MRRPSSQLGFTLIEVVVALAITALIVVAARSLLSAMSDASERVRAATTTEDQLANSELLLRSLLGSPTLSSADSGQFLGTPRAAVFRAWCPVPRGWKEPCDVALIVTSRSIPTVSLYFSGSDQFIVVRSGFSHASLCYLQSAAHGGLWTTSWSKSNSFPFAVGVVVDDDTTVVPVGRIG